MFAAVDEGLYIAVIAYAVSVVPPRKRVILALRFIFKLIEDSLVKNGVIDDDNADIVREIKLFKQDVFDGVLVNIMRFE